MNGEARPHGTEAQGTPPPRDPVDAVRQFFGEARARILEAFEDARDAAREAAEALREDYLRRTGRRKD